MPELRFLLYISYVIIGVLIILRIINDYENLTLENAKRETEADGLVMWVLVHLGHPGSNTQPDCREMTFKGPSPQGFPQDQRLVTFCAGYRIPQALPSYLSICQ